MSLNDPQWGNRNSGGPPDLEEMLRKLNRRIAALLGGKGGKGGGAQGGGSGTPKGMAGGIGLIAGIVVLVWFGSGFYIVDASQRGVVLRFGKFIGITQPGPRWHLPYPIETAEIVNLNQVRTVEVGYRDNAKNKIPQESLMLTDDENIIDIQFAVQYYLKDPSAYLFNNRAPDENVRQAAETAIREIVGKNKMDFVLYEGREQVAAATTKLIQEILDRYQTGILVSKVTMQNAQPPEQVQAAFDDAVKAGQDEERQKNEGEAYANDVVPRAKGTAARLIQEAEGYKQSVVAKAEGDASRFEQLLVQYRKAPKVTRERMLDQQKGGNSLLYLPLDKLIQSTNPGAVKSEDVLPPANTSSQQTQSSNAETDAENLRSRDIQLGRDMRDRP